MNWPCELPLIGDPDGFVTVRFQFARPAVLRRVLDQITLMPPVEADMFEILESVMCLSKAWRRSRAIRSFSASNIFFAVSLAFFSSRIRFCSVLRAETFEGERGFAGDSQGEGTESEDSSKGSCELQVVG